MTLCVAAAAQSLQLGAAYPLGATTPAGDVDADGHDDVLVAGPAGDVVSSRSGTVLAYLAHTGGTYYAAGDCNADGHDDLVEVSTSGSAKLVSGADGATLRTWTGPTTISGMFVGALPGCDLDGDGCSDVILKVTPSSLQEVYSGRTGQLIHSRYGSYLEVPYRGDWNGDGHPDLAFRLHYPPISGVTMVLGPDFQESLLSNPQPWLPSPIPLGDVNGDGTSDLATFSVAANPITLIGGVGAAPIGTLPPGEVFPFGDVDGDGHDDLQVFPSGTGTSGVWSGATLAPLPSALPAVSIGQPVGDIDRDGRIEGTNYAPPVLSIAEWSDPAVPLASLALPRGASGSTSIGHRPKLSTRGHSSLGSTLHLDARGLRPAAVAVLAVGPGVDVDLAPVGAPGNRLFAALDALYVLPVDATGLAHTTFVVPSSPTLLGATTSVQAAAVDAAANPLGLATSNAIDLAVNN